MQRSIKSEFNTTGKEKKSPKGKEKKKKKGKKVNLTDQSTNSVVQQSVRSAQFNANSIGPLTQNAN